ncbi:MAG: hypothetical protein AABX32_00915, partial [Nanoarchaeota archaeon]
VPAAHAANANLFVSAENSQFSNYMSGPQVIEVVVIDSDVNDTDEAKGEPDVTINGKKLRMAQAVDGNWYGYFADKTMAMIADSTTAVTGGGAKGSGLDFGTFCTAASALTYLGVSVSDTSGVAVPHYNSTNGVQGVFGQNGTSTGTEAITGTCSTERTNGSGNKNGTDAMEVLREVKSLNIPSASSALNIGQIGINGTKGVSTSTAAFWPFIQLYTLNPTGNVVIQYNKGGGTQTTTLTFDTVEQFAGAALDRSVYTTSSQVHLTVTDLWLNIDPTDEDSWTFGTQSSSSGTFGAYYQVFDENGLANADTVTDGVIQLTQTTLQSMMVETNGLLRVNANTQSATNPVLTIQDNGDSMLTCLTANTATSCSTSGSATTGNELDAGSVPVTITEQGPNSGIFGSYDETDTSVLEITSNAARGTSATVDYNEVPTTVLVGFNFATVDIQPTDNEWNSGEEIPIVLVDSDANKNSRADEDLDLNNPDVGLIPSLKTGDPYTLGEGTNSTVVVYANFTTGSNWGVNVVGEGINSDGKLLAADITNEAATTESVNSFSQRAIVNATNAAAVEANSIVIDLQTTMGELRNSIYDTRTNATDRLFGMNLLNLDVRSFNSTGKFDVYLLNHTTSIITNDVVNAGVGSMLIAEDVSPQSFTSLNSTAFVEPIFNANMTPDTRLIGLLIVHHTADDIADTSNVVVAGDAADPIAVDFFSYGFTGTGEQASQRIANQIIRFELEETGDNTNTFAGTLEYTMVNQLNIYSASTYTGLRTIDDEPTFIVIEDLTDEDAPRVNYLDLGADGVSTQVADQQAAPSHSG